MTSPTTIAARRYSDLHPGYDLVAAIDAAVPYSWLNLDLLVHESKRLPVVDEFVLRLCQQGVTTISGVAAVLGLDDEVVRSSVAGQLSQENIDYRPIHRPGQAPDRAIALTPDGVRAVTTLQTAAPSRVDLGWAFDRLAWAPVARPNSELMSRGDVAARSLVPLPSVHTRDVGVGDVAPRALNTLLSESGQDDVARARRSGRGALEVLSVESIARQPRRWLPVVLLVFAAADIDDVRLSVVVDDLDSRVHGQALLNAGGAGALGITVLPAIGEPELPPDLKAQRTPHGTVRGLQRRADSPPPDGAAVKPGDDDSATARAELAALTVRSVPVFEHPELLTYALDHAHRRFLLYAPRLGDAVITDDFVTRLEKMLRRRGMIATIVHGFGDSASDSRARDRLTQLAGKRSNFNIVEVTGPHHHALIFDDTWVNTSFDWLSYQGGVSRAFRREEGTLIRADVVEERYRHYLSVANR
jgi:hypothetical protein